MQIHNVYFVDHQISHPGLQLKQPFALRSGQSAAPKCQVSIRQIFELRNWPTMIAMNMSDTMLFAEFR